MISLFRNQLANIPCGGSIGALFVQSRDVERAMGDLNHFWVPPQRVARTLTSRTLGRDKIWLVQTGNWHGNSKSLESSVIYSLFKDLIEGKRGSDVMEMVRAKLPEGFKTNRGWIYTEKELQDYILDKLELYKSIKAKGFSSRVEDAIPVAVDADYRLYKRDDGKHRLVFSYLAQVDRIQVKVTNCHIKLVHNLAASSWCDSGYQRVRAMLSAVRISSGGAG